MRSIKRAMIGATLALAVIGGVGVPTTSAEAGWRGGPWRYGPYARYGYYRRPNYGGAVAAGVVGGLALGALAASRPVYAYPAYGPRSYTLQTVTSRGVRITTRGVTRSCDAFKYAIRTQAFHALRAGHER